MVSKSKKSKYKQKKQQQKLILTAGILGVIVIVLVIVAINMSVSSSKSNLADTGTGNSSSATIPDDTGTVINANMTLGNANAKYHFVEYTDLFCPYCAKFSTAVNENMNDFKSSYLDNNQVYFELRVTDLLTDDENPNNSRYAGIASYCAADKGKFWEYYEALLDTIKTKWFDKGIGAYHGAPRVPEQKLDFFYGVAKQLGIYDDGFKTCSEDGQGEKALYYTTSFAKVQGATGLPAFHFNDVRTSGFNGSYSDVKLLFKSAGVL